MKELKFLVANDELIDHDRLTGLLTKHSFESLAYRTIVDAKKFQYSAAGFIIDIDDFMSINDTLGRLASDTILIEVANKIVHSFHHDVIISRLEGDRFAALMTGEHLAEITKSIAIEILGKICTPYQLNIDTAYISASIGIAIFPQCAEEVDELFNKASIALHRAKAMGGGMFLVYEEQ